MKKITDFLQTQRSHEELQIALEVLRDFKKCESEEEYLGIMHSAWVKLEQYEEFLEHLVEDKPLRDDTTRYIER